MGTGRGLLAPSASSAQPRQVQGDEVLDRATLGAHSVSLACAGGSLPLRAEAAVFVPQSISTHLPVSSLSEAQIVLTSGSGAEVVLESSPLEAVVISASDSEVEGAAASPSVELTRARF